MQPEISRRCTACGAAIRANATFCQQCGKPVRGSEGASEPDGQRQPPQPPQQQEPVATPERAMGQEAARDIGPAKEGSAQASSPSPTPRVAVTGGQQQQRAQAESSAEAEAGERGARPRLERARAVARGAMEEKVAPRVEKLRQTSSVVLDEAADDPSLRFVLIAAVLFIAALVLFFISRLLG
jgi:cobalamin biosynthesis Mg chelatase CobN